MKLLKLASAAPLALGLLACAHGNTNVGSPVSTLPSSYLAGQLGERLAWRTEQTGECVAQARSAIMTTAQAAQSHVPARAQHDTPLRLGGGNYLTQGALTQRGQLDCSAPGHANDVRCTSAEPIKYRSKPTAKLQCGSELAQL
jgi:hypothetical protein